MPDHTVNVHATLVGRVTSNHEIARVANALRRTATHRDNVAARDRRPLVLPTRMRPVTFRTTVAAPTPQAAQDKAAAAFHDAAHNAPDDLTWKFDGTSA